MISQRLTMRADIERNQATGSDDWGGDAVPDFQPVGTVKCFAWSKNSKEALDGTRAAEIENVRMMIPLNADVQADDEIAQITDRRGTVLIAGRFRIDGPLQHKHSHREAALERIG